MKQTSAKLTEYQ